MLRVSKILEKSRIPRWLLFGSHKVNSSLCDCNHPVLQNLKEAFRTYQVLYAHNVLLACIALMFSDLWSYVLWSFKMKLWKGDPGRPNQLLPVRSLTIKKRTPKNPSELRVYSAFYKTVTSFSKLIRNPNSNSKDCLTGCLASWLPPWLIGLLAISKAVRRKLLLTCNMNPPGKNLEK